MTINIEEISNLIQCDKNGKNITIYLVMTVKEWNSKNILQCCNFHKIFFMPRGSMKIWNVLKYFSFNFIVLSDCMFVSEHPR